MSLKQAEQEKQERKTARWVYEQGRGVAAKEVARQFRKHVHTARLVIHRIMKRTDRIRCELLGIYEQTAKGLRQVKYFSEIYFPGEYQPSGRKKKGRKNVDGDAFSLC
ncbi:hypothetical protein J9Z18_000864 [Salmonella enterica]|nr:hypothetical protein [Salmonella enterica]EHI4418723.1 hypothetical protein [Salmonella enterica]